MQLHHRQLAAILFTDIVGYTALMQENEQKAVALIKHYNAVLNHSVGFYNGRILNNYGDGSLCSFSSVTEALNCALELQKELQSPPSVPLRIGLHVGEVFYEEDKALGDGVNIASRIQSLGQANTILFSKEIFDKIRNQPGFKSVSLGLFEFKNVEHPMEIFALANEGMHVPKRETMEGKLSPGLAERNKMVRKKIVYLTAIGIFLVAAFLSYSKFFHQPGFTGNEKSIAVLPFVNMSTDKENEYFSDGMTEEITTQLSKIADLKVIARTSAMLYKGSKKSIKEIAEDLGVTSILEGSVQKSGNEIRITAQLIDANTQEHIWADKYDRDFKEIFAIQSEVAQKIAHQLNAKLTKEEKRKIEKKPTNDPQAYEYYLQGNQLHNTYWETGKTEYFNNSRSMFQKALALDPRYALAHAGLADLYNSHTSILKPPDSLFLFLQVSEIEKAWMIDSTIDYVNNVRGAIEQSMGNKVTALSYYKKAVQINPNDANNLWCLALHLGEFGLYDESKVLLDRAVKLAPLTANNFLVRGYCSFLFNNYEEAIRDQLTAIQLEPDFTWAMDVLAQIYLSVGRQVDAKKMIERSLHIEPIPAKHRGENLAFAYAALGFKKSALELPPGDSQWQVLLALGMKEEAIKAMPFYNENKKELYTPYLIFKNKLATKDYEIIKNDPRFLKIMKKSQELYEENKRKYSVTDLFN